MKDDELVAEYLRYRDVPCPGCGYDLRGLGGRICPECGAALQLQLVRVGMTADDPAAERLRLAEYLAERDVPCPSCGLNLRGQKEVDCPRCGLALSVWLLKPRGVEKGARSMGVVIILALLGALWGLVAILLLAAR